MNRRHSWAWMWQQKRHLLLAVPAVVATAAVTSHQAGQRQLWEDEYATWHASTLAYPAFSRLIGHVDFALAPYYLVMHGWITVAGDSPVALRAPSIAAMALTAGLLVLLGRRLYSTRVGIVAGLLFAIVPSVSRYGQEARPYAITMFLTVLATLLLFRAIDRPTWPQWLLYGLVVVLIGLSHIVALTILVVHFLAVRHASREQDSLLPWRWLGPLVLVVATTGPFALAASAQTQAISWIKADRLTLRALPGQLFGTSTVAAVIVVIAVIGVYLRVREPGPRLPMLTAWALVAPAITYVTFPVLHVFHHRYLLFTLTAWILLAAAGLEAIGTRAGATISARLAGPARHAMPSPASVLATTAGLVAVAAIGYLALPGHVALRHDPLRGYPDFRQAALAIRADLQPGDAIVYGGDRRFINRRAMTYEMRGVLRPRDILLYQSAERLGWFTGRECPLPVACLGGTSRIWLVNTTASNDVYAELSPLVADLLRGRGTVISRTDFQRLHLVLIAIGSPAQETVRTAEPSRTRQSQTSLTRTGSTPSSWVSVASVSAT